MDKNETIELMRELELNYMEDEADDFWDNLQHEIKIDFLTSFISFYFKFYPIYNIYDQIETCDLFKEPKFPEIDQKKWMAIIYKETKIIIQLIMEKNLTGENIKVELMSTRMPGFDTEFNDELINDFPIFLPFLSKGYNINYIKEFNNDIFAKIYDAETLINRMSYFIFATYNKIILNKDYTEIAKLYNKKYIDENVDSDVNNTEVKKYASDIKQLFEPVEKKDMIYPATINKLINA
ncbi:hypothetical protein ACN9JV_06680 [Aliarcobacter butzleri]|uniref:hypothetical protein n=1 Tax=Aliarcobacter butzleri TaxID=28197 RepID=UPI0021B3F93B|nr:hypothetical protein [Aliarcobacter butzleri]MCT7562056.1 hypothetical protein [Aliarcobacter butzleri]